MDSSPHRIDVRLGRRLDRHRAKPKALHGWARGLTLSTLALLVLACAGAPHAPPMPLEADAAHMDAPPPATRPSAAATAEAPALAPSTPLAAPNATSDLVVAKGDPRGLSVFPVFTDPGELPSLHDAAGGDAFPLEHTDVHAFLSGAAADVEVTQTFKNPKTHPIEAIYVFPLPENAAVHEMRLKVGDRVVSSAIEERNAARKTYDSAKSQGFTAALLEQERANVFTQSVANIEPGKKVEVTIRYTQDLTYDAGVYEFVFPMVVGPRFIAGAPTAGAPKGSGTHGDTNRVPDASRITPPYRSGLKPGKEISLEVITEAGLAVGPFEVPNQKVKSHRDADGTVAIRLAEEDEKADRDFVLRYRVASEEPRGAMLIDRDAGFFWMMLVPPNLDVEGLVGQRELVFVVDVSGSIRGAPLERCKEAIHEALGHLRPVDTFNIITFSGHTGKAFAEPRRANDAAIRDALDFVDRARAGGSTQMLDAVAAALSPDVAEGRHRYVFFMTDGYIGEEDQILRSTGKFVSAIESKGKRAKVFGFGVGSSPNRAVLEGLSREGKGVAVYASIREDPARAVNQFFRYIDRSVLRDLKIDWGSNAVDDIMPRELPDVFASRPLIIHGRLRGVPKGPVVIHATSARGNIDIPVSFSEVPKSSEASGSEKGPSQHARAGLLGTLWARSKVTWLEGDLVSGSASARAEITRLGIDFGLVTRFTSFVAVDWSKKVEGGAPESIAQPVHVPEGVDAGASGAVNPVAPPTSAPSDGGEKPESGSGSVLADAPGPPRAEMSSRGCACLIAEPTGDGQTTLSLASLVMLGLWAARRRSRERRPR